MIIEIKIPSPGESISEVEIGNWLVEDGDLVEKDQEIAEVESDKATLPLIAADSGKISIKAKTGDMIKVGTVACTIDTSVQFKKTKAPEKESDSVKTNIPTDTETKKENNPTTQIAEPISKTQTSAETHQVKITPLAKNLMEENHLSLDDILNGLRKITSKEVRQVLIGVPPVTQKEISRESTRERMSSLRRKLASRLVSVKNETAMLTTFNEIDMSNVIELRKKYQDNFKAKHGVKLGYMSFFTKAATIALQSFPKVNSRIEGEEIITPGYVDIGIAVQSDKGLMVPVLRNTETKSLADIEKNILELANKARSNKISIQEMTGGTFTITNGGIFGSMLSTPILNPPQSAILGMHNIVDRPVAINGKVEIRPIMYLALSYDHRVIDGRESVSFLVKVKELIENPENMLLGGSDMDRTLLEI
ncbi:MAG: 2-oxoglutarate dehydrogenase complex dihydrolipoyllysine-residue succinyltransferase [Bacteroidales bacterium]|nr:2-oxoglutarate dehydrogenase complex dihydrolipoyllysine-residue succinyltransferase [Bacteroidales bacterium]